MDIFSMDWTDFDTVCRLAEQFVADAGHCVCKSPDAPNYYIGFISGAEPLEIVRMFPGRRKE